MYGINHASRSQQGMSLRSFYAVLIAVLLACIGSNSHAQSFPNHGPVHSTRGDFADFGSMVSSFTSSAVPTCLGEGWKDCRYLSVWFSAWGDNTDYSAPPSGPYSPNWQRIFPATMNCNADHSWCTGPSTDAWGTFYTVVCLPGMYWVTLSNGQQTCVSGRDVIKDNTCDCKAGLPKVGDPISPSTGVERRTVDLGVTIGGIPITATYDTRLFMLEATGATPPSVVPRASFGDGWTSSLTVLRRFRGARRL